MILIPQMDMGTLTLSQFHGPFGEELILTIHHIH